MKKEHTAELGRGGVAAENAQNCGPAPKWAALIDDRLFPMPRRMITSRGILEQAGVEGDFALVRDHEARTDMGFADDDVVDLAEGNVFRTVARCHGGPQTHCAGAAKLAFVCDDAWEVTLPGGQTGGSLKRLLGLPDDAALFRDFESPNDQAIGDSVAVAFKDGPVFTKRRGEDYCVNIEGTRLPWPKPTITTAELRKLGNLPADQPVVCEDASGGERTLREDEVVTLEPCCRFGRAPKYKRG